MRATGTRWKYVAIVVISLLGILGFGLLAHAIQGYLGLGTAPVDRSSLAVAGATLMLAAFTAYLALATSASVAATRYEAEIAEKSLAAAQEQARIGTEQVAATLAQVSATQEEAAIARETLEASWRPFLVDVPYGYATRGPSSDRDAAEVLVFADSDQKMVHVDVPLRNIGTGLAVITKAGLSATQLHAEVSWLTASFVASREVTRLGFDISQDGAGMVALVGALMAGQPFVVTVFYTDQGGKNRWRTRVYFVQPDEAPPRYGVEHVELYEGDKTEPFAVTRRQS